MTTVSAGAALAATTTPAEAKVSRDGWIVGQMTGAQAMVEALLLEGCRCVYGIPGAQENELWDTFKSKGLDYLLCTHEFSASVMADGYARATGQPGVCSIVPGPGITNALTGIGEAKLDSIPMVVLAGDVDRGCDAMPFQVHHLPNADLLRPVTKEVLCIRRVEEMASVTRHAFRLAKSGEPGPVGVVIPYDLFIESAHFHDAPPAELGVPCDESAIECAVRLLSDRSLKVGIYAGQGCMDVAGSLAELACLLQSPVATSVSGKGSIDERHPLAVGWGYGTQGTLAAEKAFKDVDLVLAIGVKYSEVSTAYYSVPKIRRSIHVDAEKCNLGRVIEPDVCVHADAGFFIDRLLGERGRLARPADDRLKSRIAKWKAVSYDRHLKSHATCGCDPMLVVQALQQHAACDAMLFVDVTMAEHWAAEGYVVSMPRTYFNPVDNQAMGWSIPAALGAQKVFPCRQTIALVGDGCFLMTALEMSTAARECLPVKFFVLDDGCYHYMQELQESAYRRTTATRLARIDYAHFAASMGIEYREVCCDGELNGGVAEALSIAGPVLIRVKTDYGDRTCRWIDTVRGRYIDELSMGQQARFLGRITGRTVVASKGKRMSD
jgi:acetolactate synthase-1/2/3 large subunit